TLLIQGVPAGKPPAKIPAPTPVMAITMSGDSHDRVSRFAGATDTKRVRTAGRSPTGSPISAESAITASATGARVRRSSEPDCTAISRDDSNRLPHADHPQGLSPR